jgi:DNA-binding transcriptional MerR regulator
MDGIATVVQYEAMVPMSGNAPDGNYAEADVVDAGVYSIGAVTRMLGIPAQTLRAWEERYAQIVPDRSGGGHRLYSRDQVEQLRFIREQLHAGLYPADAHRLLAQRRAEGSWRRGMAPARPRPDREPKVTILLAERDPYAAELAEYFLRTEGYRVRVAFDIAPAEEMLRAEAIDLLVVDLMISGGGGLDLCRRARERSSIAVLAVSALDFGDAALQAGADAFMRKPLEPLRLISTVRHLLAAGRRPASAGARA